MRTNKGGFEEVAHTADWEIHIWAPDLPGLLIQAARGMLVLTQTEIDESQPDSREVEIAASDPESLLVAFLSHLLFLGETEGVAFREFDLNLDGYQLAGVLRGGRVARRGKEIKAVTYHNLLVQPGPEGLETNLVFDV